MTHASSRNFIVVVLNSLGAPLLWGLGACIGFYALIHAGLIDNEMVRRYFAGHPVEYVETAMVMVGLAALAIKLIGIVHDFSGLRTVALPDVPDGGQRVEESSRLLDHLGALSAGARNSYLGRRLRDALEHVRRTGAAEGLDEELKYLSDLDASRQYEGYALVRIIVWATPMLGFLGTVIGITLALADLSPAALVNSPEEAMQGLLAGLSVAFDTTALAISLSIVVMFAQFLTNQLETELLSAVDVRAETELLGRFQTTGSASDPQLAAVRRMAEQVVQSADQLVGRQAEIWRKTMDASHQRWQQQMAATGQQLETSLSGALGRTMHEHARELQKSEEAVQLRAERYCQQLEKSLVETARAMHNQQRELARLGELMSQVVGAVGDIGQLEGSLNNNLKALAGSKNFEDTVMSLSAAIHLLNSRLSEPPSASRRVDLDRVAREDRAA